MFINCKVPSSKKVLDSSKGYRPPSPWPISHMSHVLVEPIPKSLLKSLTTSIILIILLTTLHESQLPLRKYLNCWNNVVFGNAGKFVQTTGKLIWTRHMHSVCLRFGLKRRRQVMLRKQLWLDYIVHEPDQMSVPLLVANAIIPFWKALGVRNEKKCDSQSDSVAFRFYKHF